MADRTDFAWNDHAPLRGKFKLEASPVAFLRALWRACMMRLACLRDAFVIRCGVFLHRLIKKMHRMHRFVMLFVDMLLRKAE
jgi:hypothetical protein